MKYYKIKNFLINNLNWFENIININIIYFNYVFNNIMYYIKKILIILIYCICVLVFNYVSSFIVL